MRNSSLPGRGAGDDASGEPPYAPPLAYPGVRRNGDSVDKECGAIVLVRGNRPDEIRMRGGNKCDDQ